MERVPSRRYVLGVDLGTGGPKVVLAGSDGTLLGRGHIPIVRRERGRRQLRQHDRQGCECGNRRCLTEHVNYCTRGGSEGPRVRGSEGPM